MYECNMCGEKFIFPEKVRPDSGPMYYPGDSIKFNTPLISICPECRSVDIEILPENQPTPYIAL